jgi:hypothetical protein
MKKLIYCLMAVLLVCSCSTPKRIRVIVVPYNAKLEKWTNEYVEGTLTEEEFVWLLNSEKDLIDMRTLKSRK